MHNGDSKRISQGRVTSRPVVQRERTKRQTWRNGRENNAQGIYYYTLDWSQSKVFLVFLK